MQTTKEKQEIEIALELDRLPQLSSDVTTSHIIQQYIDCGLQEHTRVRIKEYDSFHVECTLTKKEQVDRHIKETVKPISYPEALEKISRLRWKPLRKTRFENLSSHPDFHMNIDCIFDIYLDNIKPRFEIEFESTDHLTEFMNVRGIKHIMNSYGLSPHDYELTTDSNLNYWRKINDNGPQYKEIKA